MAILNELKALYIIMFRTIQDVIDNQLLFMWNYFRTILFIFAFIFCAVSGYFGYRWYVVVREQNAYATIAACMFDYQRAIKQKNAEGLQRLDTDLLGGYLQHKGSNVAPLFLMLRSEVALKQNNFVEAINLLQQAIDMSPSSFAMLSLLKTKKALILLDSADEAMQKDGIHDLTLLARDTDNIYRCVALFYLGRYYWSLNNIEDAKKTWQELVDTNIMEKAYPSVWAQEAKKALKQITE